MKYSVIAIIASSAAATSMLSMSSAGSTSMLWATEKPDHAEDYDQRGFSNRLCEDRGDRCLVRKCMRGDIKWLMQGMQTVHENANDLTLDEMRNGENKD